MTTFISKMSVSLKWQKKKKKKGGEMFYLGQQKCIRIDGDVRFLCFFLYSHLFKHDIILDKSDSAKYSFEHRNEFLIQSADI